jgi:NADH-quinone oxidoreductase subunit N
MTFMDSLNAVLPEEVLSLGGIVLMLAAAWAGKGGARAINTLAVLLLVVAAILSTVTGGTAFDGMIKADAFSTFARVLIYGSAAVALMMAPRWFASEEPLKPEYGVLMILAAAGMGVMVSANNLIALYVGIELNSLAAYVLASFMRKDQRTAEAGLKYFVLGALASGMILYGMSLLYGFSGSVDYGGVSTALKDGVSLGEMFGIVFLMAGLAFKVSAVPFHMWTPDVYEGAPTPVTTFFASAPKVAAMAMLVRIAVVALGPAGAEWQQIVIFTALASIILGAVGAIGQTNIKRLLAYSSINNVGFALVGLAAAGSSEVAGQGVAAVLSYMAIYVVMTLGAFACVMQMRDADGQHIEDISSLSGLSQTNKPLAAALAILMFSLAGIPPLFGFWAKFLVFKAAVAAGLLPLAAIGIAASVIGAFYYLRIIKLMYFDAPAPAYRPVESYAEASVILVSSLVLVLGYLLIPVLDATSAAAARSLF